MIYENNYIIQVFYILHNFVVDNIVHNFSHMLLFSIKHMLSKVFIDYLLGA
jgi:hypothetical protein